MLAKLIRKQIIIQKIIIRKITRKQIISYTINRQKNYYPENN